MVAARDAHAALGATITVTTTADEYDIASPNASCSLREALQSSNDGADRGGCTHTGFYGANTIVLGTATYTLSRAGLDDDANQSADLDITDNVTITGNGAGSTFIAGGSNYAGRIVHVVSGVAHVKNLTLKGGNVPNGRAGGGLRTEPGTSTTLDGVVVGQNSADGNAGGILNRGTMTLNGSAVTGNHVLNATQGGGGLFNDDNAVMTLNDSRVLNNTVSGDPVDGAGIYSDLGSQLTLVNTTVADNIADETGLTNAARGEGGGIFASNVTVQITQSTVSGNSVNAHIASGGGLYLENGIVTIVRTLVSGNVATSSNGDTANGGGLSAYTNFLMRDSIVDGNQIDPGNSGGGAGAGIQLVFGTIIHSMISNNYAISSNGGGLSMAGDAALVDTTVANNKADGNGGGVYFNDGGAALQQVLSSTIVGNQSNVAGLGSGSGGGLYFSHGNPLLANSVIAGNLAVGDGSSDDCDGGFTSAGHVLVQTASGCSLLGVGVGNQLNVTAGLAALADNGGPIVGASNATVTAKMLTRLPLSNSPLIDAGDPAGCKDENGEVLTVDQRGFTRAVDGPDGDPTPTCDIGAAEFAAVFDPIFADGFD